MKNRALIYCWSGPTVEQIDHYSILIRARIKLPDSIISARLQIAGYQKSWLRSLNCRSQRQFSESLRHAQEVCSTGFNQTQIVSRKQKAQ